MVFLDLELQFTTENVQCLYVDEGFQYFFEVKCSQCNAEHPNEIYFSELDSVDTTTSKSKCNFFMNCKECKKSMQINVHKQSGKKINCKEGKNKGVLATFECRGVELVKWVPQEGIFANASESGTVFDNVDLSDTWCEYDEATQNSLQIDDFKCSINRNNKLK